VRAQAVVNSRTQKVYVATTSASLERWRVSSTGRSLSTATRINNTSSSWGVVINEAANLVFASTIVGGNGFGLRDRWRHQQLDVDLDTVQCSSAYDAPSTKPAARC
jgi:hypothetical protein